MLLHTRVDQKKKLIYRANADNKATRVVIFICTTFGDFFVLTPLNRRTNVTLWTRRTWWRSRKSRRRYISYHKITVRNIRQVIRYICPRDLISFFFFSNQTVCNVTLRIRWYVLLAREPSTTRRLTRWSYFFFITNEIFTRVARNN